MMITVRHTSSKRAGGGTAENACQWAQPFPMDAAIWKVHQTERIWTLTQNYCNYFKNPRNSRPVLGRIKTRDAKLGATSSDRSTRIAPRTCGHQGVITPYTHGCPGPGSPRRRCRTVNVVPSRRDDRIVTGRSADVVPLHNTSQRQVLDYHALSEDFCLIINPAGVDLTPSGHACGNGVQL